MLPSSLFSIYQQYKEDTDSVASWLASTAKACGYPSDLLTPTGIQTKGTGRLKGKARRDAKKQNTYVPTPLHTIPKYVIAVKDFIPLAEFIFASKPLISVPPSFAETLDRVIYVRAKFGAQLIDHGMKSSTKSDATHSFFVGILEKVRDVLRPRMPAGTKSFQSFEDLGNCFSGIKVYESSPELLDVPDIERPKNAQGDDTIYEAEPQTSLEDALVAYTIMVNDLNQIRSYIEWIWSNNRDGYFDLANAAVATNTGINLARNLIDQVLPIFKDHGGACTILEKFSFICARRDGFSEDDILSWGPAGKDEDIYEVADKTYLNASLLLDGLARVLPPNHLPIYKEGMFGMYDPQSDRTSKKGQAKFKEDLIILSEFFTEAVTLARLVPNYPAEDEFIRGIRELDTTGNIPFHLVYATQILLDVHHTIRDRASNALDSLLKHTTTMDDELSSHIEFHENLKIENWPASNERALREFKQSLQWFAQDPVFLAKQRISQRAGSLAMESEKHRILAHSPILCGLVLYHFRAKMYNFDIAITNAWGSITYPAHLYNALRNEGLLNGHWTDMDAVQTLLGDSNLFVGERPENRHGYLKHFLLQMGYSASTFAVGGSGLLRRPGRHHDLASRGEPRGIKDGAPVSCMFVERYVRGSGQIDLSPEHVNQIISRSRFQEEGSEKNNTLMLTLIDDRDELRKKRQPKQRKKMTGEAQWPPGELLRSLVLALGAETLEFSFPYLLMHRWCWQFLRHVKEACDFTLKQLYTTSYIEKESELPFVVGYIFMAASDDQERKGEFLMRAAAKVLNVMIEGGAGELVLGVVRNAYGFQVEFATEDDSDNSGSADSQ
ncbi:hypothetical protein FOPG_17079 [Fusarium oxysporum f. sp. conglutinans race 2 54008]|uniref:DUF6604 domain-containing protein n=4 Tax=Fusarium oxysporum TaxID=5507 RepID=A0A8H6GD29_FUSOX|nr:hypothetical protein FOXB_03018 [Fusarium oxysporum f. sp. conglutinans Fo5176]EXL66767.1 hypothetical protein FOPG_17079 [Fusarium oxysporum f. sp. conglutinans race 2 54008]KAF6515802.1 hypothetical protein HZS61_004543 [Fusarium oxysporum f. sp. conglutinans]KAG6979329.1 hypothetical protein FocnCong_v010414 [Fusarium oxysporum f. sp. conglutinans]KAI8402212.1 hypothetical protein FOFC_17518 [Fusarium oxysporum]